MDDSGYGGRLDYFFILGPEISSILDRYTQLTGRPRLPPLAMFGLGLSDKSNDETTSDPSDEHWWKRKVLEHRRAGFPLDHLINDNRWRAGGGKRCESYFDWDRTRFPDPAEFERWLREQGLLVTIDFNRCIAQRSDGFKQSYNIPDTSGIDFADSTPDFTRREVREWFWKVFWRKSIDPSVGYPGDASVSVADDDLFGTSSHRAIGESWPISTDVIGRLLKEIGAQGETGLISGFSKLERVENNHIVVTSLIDVRGALLAIAPEVKTESGEIKVEYHGRIPLAQPDLDRAVDGAIYLRQAGTVTSDRDQKMHVEVTYTNKSMYKMLPITRIADQ